MIGAETERYRQSVTGIYSEHYAEEYPALYFTPWTRKHELNAANLNRILDAIGPVNPSWLDLACGQAWHFSLFSGRARMLGLDLSLAQLVRAKRNAPHADFVCADMARAALRKRSFDLVTMFWAGYCYLGSRDRIGSLLHDVTDWTRPGGSFYMEVLLARDLETFNQSRFAGTTGFTVVPRSADYTAWCYYDSGGTHVMMSPPLEFFVHALAPQFETIQATHDGAFMVHLIAAGRRG